MTGARSVPVIREDFDAGAATRAVAETAGASDVRVERTIYYPYHWYRVAGSAPTWVGRRPFTVTCLVDARSGAASTADRFTVEPATVSAGALLLPRTEAIDATRQAERYLSHALGRRLRAIASFGLTLDHRGLVYKAYRILRCDGTGVLLDGVTGELHPLRQ